jgi:chemotaxis response regulator CheB
MTAPGTPERPVRVLVVGNDRRIRSGLVGLLVLDPSIELSGIAVDVAGALACCRETPPDVVLVDPHLPDVPDGVTLVTAVRRLLPTARVVSVCVADDDDPDDEFDVRLHATDDPGRIMDLVAQLAAATPPPSRDPDPAAARLPDRNVQAASEG